MKKMKITPAAVLVLISTFSWGQTSFLKTLGKNKADVGYCVIATNDSAFVIGGNLDTDGFGKPDLFIMKVNYKGDTLWTRTYQAGNSSYLRSIIQSDDSGFVCLGYRFNFNYDINVFKLDKNGNLLWEKKYGGSGHDVAYSITETKDGNYAFCGYTRSFGGGYINMYVVKINNSGDSLWTKVFSTDTTETLTSIINTPDNGFMVAGQTWGYGFGEGDAVVMKLDSLGDIEWTKTYGGRWDEMIYSMSRTSDGNYILAGMTESWLGGVVTDTTVHPAFYIQDAYVLKIKPDGDTLWTKTYGGGAANTAFDAVYSITELSNGNYLLGGESSSFTTTQGGAYLITINSQGDTIHSKLIDGNTTDLIRGMAAKNDGSVILTGSTMSFGSGEEDILLAAIDINSNAGCNDVPAPSIIGNTYTKILSTFSPTVSSGASIDTTGFVRVYSGGIVTDVCGCSISPVISGVDSACIDSTVTLKATGGKYYQWSNGSTADSVSFTITSDTTFSVIASNDTCSAMVSHTVIAKNCITGIHENLLNDNHEISVSPNPSSEMVYINIKSGAIKHEKYSIELYNYLGQKLSEQYLHEGQNVFDVSSLGAGIYLYKIKLVSDKNIIGCGKIVKTD